MEVLAERGQKGLKLCAYMSLVFLVCHGTMAAQLACASAGAFGNGTQQAASKLLIALLLVPLECRIILPRGHS